MAISEEIGKFVADLMGTIRAESIEWQKKYQADSLKLKEEQALAELRTKQQLQEMEIRFKAYCERVQMEEKHHTRQFEEFLDSIDQTKSKMLQFYAHMPAPVSLMIHHHATELLKEAWYSQDARERLRKQNQFTELMLTISEDLTERGESERPKELPERTIKLIRGGK